MERTRDERRRLVLGFDAGCMTCSGLAEKIQDRVGDRIEVRSLNDIGRLHHRRHTRVLQQGLRLQEVRMVPLELSAFQPVSTSAFCFLKC